jgi:hypothetical protein
MAYQVNGKEYEEEEDDMLRVESEEEFNRVVGKREERTGKKRNYKKLHHNHGHRHDDIESNLNRLVNP